MKFTAVEEIDRPVDAVFAAVTDFATFERRMRDRGATVTRRGGTGADAVAGWTVDFSFRGRPRRIVAEVARCRSPDLLALDLGSEGLTGTFRVDLLPLPSDRTRMSASIDLSASTLTSRMLLQSLKLARANLTNRFRTRVAAFARTLDGGDVSST